MPSANKAAGKCVEDGCGNSSDTEDETPDSSSEEKNPIIVTKGRAAVTKRAKDQVQTAYLAS
jgi:hypothetical protein